MPINPDARVITALDLLTRSMKLISAIGAGEELDPEDAVDGLSTFNEMLDNWTTERISVYGVTNETFALQAGIAQYSYGPGGDFNSDRPVHIRDPFSIVDGVSRRIGLIPQEEYDRIALKNQPGSWPIKALMVNSFPLAEMFFWPVPITMMQIQIPVSRQLTHITDLTQVISLPPGYLRALRFSLAAELWPEYSNGSTDINTIKQIAMGSRADIQRANQTDPIATFDDVPNVNRQDYTYLSGAL